MPWLPIYADEQDFRVILDRLNGDEEIAFIVPDGSSLWRARWRATRPLSRLEAARICLWHVPSGPLPLLHRQPDKKAGTITNPWNGWTGLRDSAHKNCPFFGAGHPGIIWLNHRPQAPQTSGGIGLSSFEWIGNRYSAAGSPASEATEKFWQSLQRWVKKGSVKVPRDGPVDGPQAEIWAFPSALAAFRNGRGREANPCFAASVRSA